MQVAQSAARADNHPSSTAQKDKITTEQAMDHLRKVMKEDEGYAWTWHCNIAVTAQDEGLGHEASNKAAARAMYNIFNVDTSQHEAFKSLSTYWVKLEKKEEEQDTAPVVDKVSKESDFRSADTAYEGKTWVRKETQQKKEELMHSILSYGMTMQQVKERGDVQYALAIYKSIEKRIRDL